MSSWGLDPNFLAVALSAALIGLVGLLNAPTFRLGPLQPLGWFLAALFLLAIVQTGSRGGSLALLAGLIPMLLFGQDWVARLKNIVVTVLLLAGFAWQLSVSPMATERWEETVESGDTSGRTEIYSVAWRLFLEKPWFGWGPLEHTYEIGRRLHAEPLATHNTVLGVLDETGIVGALPFLCGVAACLLAAWKAREGRYGVMPLAMLVTVLAGCLSLSANRDRVLWFVFAFVLARGDRRPGSERSWLQSLLARWTARRQLAAADRHAP